MYEDDREPQRRHRIKPEATLGAVYLAGYADGLYGRSQASQASAKAQEAYARGFRDGQAAARARETVSTATGSK